MVIVVTGGEPLLVKKTVQLFTLISGIKNKGIIVDTNGTIQPEPSLLNLFRESNVLLRVSLDSIRPGSEIALRLASGGKKKSEEMYFQKINNIKSFVQAGVRVAIQTVLHKQNSLEIDKIPEKLQTWNINKWFVQRLIPTESMRHTDYYTLDRDQYELLANALPRKSTEFGVSCITKKDRRHNCVFLMVYDGKLYTSSDNSEERIFLGYINTLTDFFAFVSSSEHSARYYEHDGNSL
jgi:MoaA/NifB/PqqE/SkfB family radical SAM enzyme